MSCLNTTDMSCIDVKNMVVSCKTYKKLANYLINEGFSKSCVVSGGGDPLISEQNEVNTCVGL